MRFSDYPTLAKQTGYASEQDLANHLSRTGSKDEHANFRAAAEFQWVSHKRPYYSVYPGIVDPLLKVKLDIPLDSLQWPIEKHIPILIRLADDREGLRAVLCGISERGWYTSCYCVQNGEAFIYMGLIGKKCKTVEEDLAGLDLGIMHDWARDSFRLAMGICLLGNDSEFIQPEVLTADQIKFGMSRDMKLVEKAKKRGKYGWTVGREIECLPHIRRPHFAVRWTGKGGAVPKVVPVKGSVVKRKTMTDVPTGYMDDEDSSSS
jgi:hypothetical protein